jgi:glutathione S-transferase
VDQILAVVTDAVAEGRLAFHPKDFYKSHKMQVEESKPYIEQYGSERLPKYMQVSVHAVVPVGAVRIGGGGSAAQWARSGWAGRASYIVYHRVVLWYFGHWQ